MGFAPALRDFPSESLPFENGFAARVNLNEGTTGSEEQTETTDHPDLLWLGGFLCFCSAVSTLGGAYLLINTLVF